jgi:ParB family chromosome partitioning protein
VPKRVESEKKVAVRKFNAVAQMISDNAKALEEGDSKNNKALIVSLEKIRPNPNQPRKVQDNERDQELTENIKEHGVLEPILVREIEEGGYEIVAGERRWRAAGAAGLKQVPVIVKDYDNKQAQFVSVIENLQRLDLDPLDEAHYFKFLIDNYNYSYRDIARMINRSHGYVNERMRRIGMGEASDDSDKGNNRQQNGQKLQSSQADGKPVKEPIERYNVRPVLSFNNWVDRVHKNFDKFRPDELADLRLKLDEISVKIKAIREMLPNDEQIQRMKDESL